MKKNSKRHIRRKANTRKKNKGGLRQKDSSLTSWQAVYKMINIPGATLTKIAFSSLKGYIFRLDIPNDPDITEFFGLNADGTAMNRPVYSLIFKFAIIAPRPIALPMLAIPGDHDDDGNPVAGRHKETEDLESFKTEAIIQQGIYTGTLSPLGRPITISVVDFSYFNARSSNALLRQLMTIPGNSHTVQLMLTFLHDNVIATRQLGLITMELANSEFRELSKVENAAAFTSDCDYALAQIFILFTRLKVMNYDCHAGNVLASRNPPSAGLEERSVLIDFGRTLNFRSPHPFPDNEREIITGYETLTVRTYATDLAEVLSYDATDLYVGGRTTQEMVIEKMEKILKFMTYVDYVTNTTYFDMTDMNRPQLITFLRHLYGPGFSDDWGKKRPDWRLTPGAIAMYANIIPIIRALTQSPQQRNLVSADAIRGRIASGEILTIREDGLYSRNDVSTWTPAAPVEKDVMDRGTVPLLRQRRAAPMSAAVSVGPGAKCKDDDPSCCDKVTGCLFGKKDAKGGKTRRKNKRGTRKYKKRNDTRKR